MQIKEENNSNEISQTIANVGWRRALFYRNQNPHWLNIMCYKKKKKRKIIYLIIYLSRSMKRALKIENEISDKNYTIKMKTRQNLKIWNTIFNLFWRTTEFHRVFFFYFNFDATWSNQKQPTKLISLDNLLIESMIFYVHNQFCNRGHVMWK